MAAFRTIVARTGFTEAMISHLDFQTTFVNKNGQWVGLVADDETLAIAEANEKFENDGLYTDWLVTPDSTDAWEITDADGEVIGWSMTADGYPADHNDL